MSNPAKSWIWLLNKEHAVWVAIIGSIATVSCRDVQDQSAWILLQFLAAQKYLWVEMIIGFSML